MAHIVHIPAHIISRIAAGEVIERPVYAVKELVENSLDAHATTISIQIESGGLRKIVVTDNGQGMSYADLLESFKPHTTSKLVEDSLIGIQTLGFRGEALASIAAVSDMYIQSRTLTDAAGTQVVLHAGEVKKISPVGMPFGTSVTVENLFYTVPARKKFLKSERTEFRHIVELISQYALSFPDTRFLLLHNGRVVLDLPTNQTKLHRLEALLKRNITYQLLPISAENSYIAIDGYIAHPQVSTPTVSKQYIFINNRVIADRSISSAVKQEYGSLLAKTQYPVFMINISIPFEMVDVNVHPRKEQVSIANHEALISLIRFAIQETFAHHNLTYSVPISSPYSARRGSTDSNEAQILREAQTLWNVKDPLLLSPNENIYQMYDTYLVMQTKKGLLLIDQHAAHERILYEQILSTYKKQVQNKYVLKKPLILDLTPTEIELLHEYLHFLTELGFDIRKVKEEFTVYSLPQLFKDRNIPQLIQEIAENIEESGDTVTLDSVSDTMIAFLACRGAIKAGEKLTKDEAKRLIKKLEKTQNNATCPHGRPTRILLPLQQVNKWFRRE